MSTTGLVDTARNPYGRELTNWDANLAAQFRALEQQGFDAREIFLQTRTWRGADGRVRQERMQRGVSSLPGYGQPTAVSEAVSGFVGAPRRFSVMDSDAQAMQQARDLGEQASVASQLYGALTPFAAGATMAKAGQMGGIAAINSSKPQIKRYEPDFNTVKIYTQPRNKTVFHNTDFDSPVISDKEVRLIPNSLSAGTTPNLVWGKNTFNLTIPKGAKVAEVRNIWQILPDNIEDTPLNLGKALREYAQKNSIDVIKIGNVPGVGQEWAIINPSLLPKK